MTQGILQIFRYREEDKEQDFPFRTAEIGGEVWFYVTDICKALGIGNPSDASRSLDRDDLDSIEGVDSLGKKQTFNITSEAGLYHLIFQSRKEGARKFKNWVTHEVLPSIRRTGFYKVGNKDFVRRFNENWDRVSPGYFSVISELHIRIFGRFEQLGYHLSEKSPKGEFIRPDISVGRMFAQFLRDAGIEDQHRHYLHWTPHGEFPARQYPNSLWHIYINFVETVWIPQNAHAYLAKRDKNALEYLPKLLETSDRYFVGDTSKKRGRPDKKLIQPIKEIPERVV